MFSRFGKFFSRYGWRFQAQTTSQSPFPEAASTQLRSCMSCGLWPCVTVVWLPRNDRNIKRKVNLRSGLTRPGQRMSLVHDSAWSKIPALGNDQGSGRLRIFRKSAGISSQMDVLVNILPRDTSIKSGYQDGRPSRSSHSDIAFGLEDPSCCSSRRRETTTHNHIPLIVVDV